MLQSFVLVLGFQLIGEVFVRILPIGIPGPVIGMTLLAIACIASPGLRHACEKASAALLGNLSLLFLPAAVGVVQFLPLIRTEGLAIGVAILVSTALAIAVTALTFRFVVHHMKLENRE
jgi:holin-like protein